MTVVLPFYQRTVVSTTFAASSSVMVGGCCDDPQSSLHSSLSLLVGSNFIRVRRLYNRTERLKRWGYWDISLYTSRDTHTPRVHMERQAYRCHGMYAYHPMSHPAHNDCAVLRPALFRSGPRTSPSACLRRVRRGETTRLPHQRKYSRGYSP